MNNQEHLESANSTKNENLIWYSNPDFPSNLESDLDVCQTAPIMCWIHSLVSTSHFAKYRKKSAGDCMRNANRAPKIPDYTMVREWKSDQESVSGTGSPPKVNHF